MATDKDNSGGQIGESGGITETEIIGGGVVDTDSLNVENIDKWDDNVVKPEQPIEPIVPTVTETADTSGSVGDGDSDGDKPAEKTTIGTMQFKSKGGELYTVTIKKSGFVLPVGSLTPTAQPFSTQEDDSDDPLEALRGSTGYVRFMYDGGVNLNGAPWWVEFMPTDATEISVTMTDSTDAVLWQGFVKPSQYSQDYGTTVREIELPIVSALEVLKAVEMDSTKVMQSASMRELIVEAMDKVGVTISTVMVPFEWGTGKLSTTYINSPAKDINWQAPMTAKVSRFAWFSVTSAKNDGDPNYKEYEGETYADALGDWARFWGWTLRERGAVLWIVSRRAKTYVKVDWTTFCRTAMVVLLSDPSNYTRKTSVTLTDEKLDGVGHSLDITPAVRTVKVSADTQEIERKAIGITDNDYKYSETEYIDDPVYRCGLKTSQTYNYKTLYYDFTGKNLTQWEESETFADGTRNAKRAQYARVDAYPTSDLVSKKNWDYKEGILATLAVKKLTGGVPVFDDLRIVELKSAKSFEIDRGWLCVNVSLENLHYYTDFSTIRLRLQFGDKYWNGTTWTTTESNFDVQMKKEDENYWKWSTKDTKTLAKDCNGAAGYIVEVSQQMSGEIKLSWIASQVIGPTFATGDQILVQNFAVEYYGKEDEEARDLESVNNYYANTGATGTETKEISLKLATMNNNNAGYGILKTSNGTADGETFVTMSAEGQEAKFARPEEVLLGIGVGKYGKARKTLKMEVTMSDRERPIDTVTRSEWSGTAFEPVAEAIEWAEDRRVITLIG